jgi:hypothetical protein
MYDFLKPSKNVSEPCRTLDKTWNHVTTAPALPVNHGVTVTLNCPRHYVNSGGSKATCTIGQLVPENEPPQCSLTIGKLSMLTDNCQCTR